GFGEVEIRGEPSCEADAGDAAPAKEEALDGEAAARPDAAIEEAPVADADASDTPVPYTLTGIGEKTVRKLVDAGLATQEAVAAATIQQLSAIPGSGGKPAETVLRARSGETGDT